LIGEADAPWRAGGELFAGDESVIEPPVQGGGGDAEFGGGVGDGEHGCVLGLIGGFVAGDVVVVA
jgi:hypothetical protein